MPKETYFNLPDEKRERFLEAAINEFADNDYPNASISKVCKQAGIAKGSFYQYFEDKKDLLMYMIELSLVEKQVLIDSIEIPDSESGFFDSLRWVFKVQTGYSIEHPRLTEVIYRAFYGALPFKDEMIENLKQAGYDGYRQLLLKGIEDGSIRPDIDLDAATFMISTLFAELGRYIERQLKLDNKAMFTRELSDAQWEEASKVFDGLLRLLESGLKASD
ncbi:MAG: TetR/AcrR family transcriptional regulator [Chloroflexota bacterium]